MELESLKKCTDWFRVHELKDIVDPSGQVARKELVVSLEQYPYNFGLGPNPREPDPTSRVSKRIGETLKENWQNFHLLNRGVVVVAKDIEYDNKSQRIRLTLDETEEEKRLLDARLGECERNPSSFVPWEEAKARIMASRKR
jgi:hypothetical protein